VSTDNAGQSGRKPAPPVSPLAPAGGFPALPAIDGVRFAAVEAGVRYRGRLDVMLAEVTAGASIAGVFTRSATRSAPVLWCQEALARLQEAGPADGGFAIVVNSGNANAFTGGAGRAAVEATVAAVAATLGVPERHVLVASTGVIGEPLPAERIVAAMRALGDGLDAGGAALAARAIMTTDTFPKGATATVELDGVPVTITGFAKGSGMIAPDMATMLVFLFTDAAIAPGVLQAMVARANARTFNCITVDGDTSTSDSLYAAATGRAAMAPIATEADARAMPFEAALTRVMRDLAHQVVRDGEGATKFVEVRVTGAESDGAARRIGLSIANSPLVKTAIAGEDPNWGRVVMAVGKAGEAADRDRLSIRFGDILVAERGWVSPGYSEAAGAAYMKNRELVIAVDLGIGEGEATVWTCDLTHRYIEINADYRS
jgi:glutamate N-acetyltransferase/amino-acid N-acetyltransferase